MIEVFIRKKGVTKCPPVGSKALVEACAKREKEQESKIASWGWHGRRKA
jgi:hypothetical protein